MPQKKRPTSARWWWNTGPILLETGKVNGKDGAGLVGRLGKSVSKAHESETMCSDRAHRVSQEVWRFPSAETFDTLGRDKSRDPCTSQRTLEVIHTSLEEFFFSSLSRNPNSEGLPHWPEYHRREESYLQIGATIKAAQKLKEKEVTFWMELRATEALKIHQREHIGLWTLSWPLKSVRPNSCIL